MFYFAYCTLLDEPIREQWLPDADFVTKARAVSHILEFRTAGGRDRGWCHLNNTADAFELECRGLLYDAGPNRERHTGNDQYERIFLTVHGEDGEVYDAYTSALVTPGTPMRLPDDEWENVRKGLDAWQFPSDYIERVYNRHDAAAPCP